MAERTSSHVLGATLLGGAMGATLALLFAPRSGRETRERIKHAAEDMRSDATDTLNKAKTKVREGVDSARDMKGRLTDAAKQTGKQAEETIHEQRSRLDKKEEV